MHGAPCMSHWLGEINLEGLEGVGVGKVAGSIPGRGGGREKGTWATPSLLTHSLTHLGVTAPGTSTSTSTAAV